MSVRSAGVLETNDDLRALSSYQLNLTNKSKHSNTLPSIDEIYNPQDTTYLLGPSSPLLFGSSAPPTIPMMSAVPQLASPYNNPSSNSTPSSLVHRSSALPQQDAMNQSKWGFSIGLGKHNQIRESLYNSNFSSGGSNLSAYGPQNHNSSSQPPHWIHLSTRQTNNYKCYEGYEGTGGPINCQYSVLRFPHDCDETAAGEETTGAMTISTRSTATPPSHVSSFDASPRQMLYRGPMELPEIQYMRLYDSHGPVCFQTPSIEGGQHIRAELRSWPQPEELIISQNSSKRKVHRGVWLSPLYPDMAFPVAVKFVEDQNARDGRSIKREIECHLFIYQRLQDIQKLEGYPRLEDAWPSAELLGYHLDKKNPGRCMLITRKLSGPDFFDVIRQEHSREGRIKLSDEFHKLHWCSIALKRVQQYARLGIRHNDIKPDNIVIDWYRTPENERLLDVKIIDLGTASMHHAKDFTGGTSWYESPEQKILEYYSKKQRNQEAAKKVDIGLASDVWAAGLSITEVLVGKRVVDALKHPHGPGPLDYRGPMEGWALEPYEWVQIARNALLLGPRRSTNYTFCYDAAKWIFDHLVHPIATERASLQDAINVLAEQSELALLRSKRTPTTRSMASVGI